MPLSHPNVYISLIDDKCQEICMITSLDDLDEVTSEGVEFEAAELSLYGRNTM